MEPSHSNPLVFINILIFFLMLYTFPTIYYRISGNKNNNINYLIFGILLTTYSVLCYVDKDFYHYQEIYNSVKHIGYSNHLEPIYVWLINNFSFNYLSWRFVIWGTATIFLLLTISRLKLDIRSAICILAIFYVSTFSFLRMSLGVSILFYGYSLIIKLDSLKRGNVILGTIIVLSSVFFHRSIFIMILILFISSNINLKKKHILYSTIGIVVISFNMNIIFDHILNINFNNIDNGMGIESKVNSYINGEKSTSNIFGMLSKVILYFPNVLALLYFIKKITFDEYRVPKYIQTFLTFWYISNLIAYIFFFQEVSNWLFVRFMYMSYFPMSVVLIYYYSRNRSNIIMKTILLLGLLTCAYKLSYTVYSMI